MSWLCRARASAAAVFASAVLLAAAATPVRAQEPSTTTTTPPETTTTTAEATTTTAVLGPPAQETTTTSPTSSTSEPAAPSEEEELPPASPVPLPPEEEPPPPPPPLALPTGPPAGADDAGRARARAELRAAEAALRSAQARAQKLAKSLVPHQRRFEDAVGRMQALSDDDRRAADELAASRLRLRKMAVAGYVRGGDTQPIDYLLRASDPVDLERRRLLIEAATAARASALQQHDATRRAASDQLEAAVKDVEEARAALAVFDAEVSSAAVIVTSFEREVDNRRLLLDLAAATAPVAATDIPRIAWDAYRAAAATLARKAPHCRVGWTAIAAIGKVESNHGRYRGAQFALNGDVFPRILGIPLDGTRSALIRDTDLGVLDYDTEFDRAVGPMQFIPSTWKRIDQDGNGDGIRDPNNIYDAALGTATYLCRTVPSGGLDTDEGLRPAFFAYNHSSAYVEHVLGWAHTYGALTAAGV